MHISSETNSVVKMPPNKDDGIKDDQSEVSTSCYNEFFMDT